MNTAIDKELHAYIDNLDSDQKKSLLSLIKSFFKSTNSERISMEQYNREIDEAMKEIDEGHYVSQEDLEKQAAQGLKK